MKAQGAGLIPQKAGNTEAHVGWIPKKYQCRGDKADDTASSYDCLFFFCLRHNATLLFSFYDNSFFVKIVKKMS